MSLFQEQLWVNTSNIHKATNIGQNIALPERVGNSLNIFGQTPTQVFQVPFLHVSKMQWFVVSEALTKTSNIWNIYKATDIFLKHYQFEGELVKWKAEV